MHTCEILRYVRVELLGLSNVRPKGCCIQQLHSICALWGTARLVHAQHMAAQGPVLQPHNCASSQCICLVKQACKEPSVHMQNMALHAKQISFVPYHDMT